MMILYKILFLIIPVIACGFIVVLMKLKSAGTTKLLLSFSGAYILALCLFHLIPDVYLQMDNPEWAGWSILAGFLLQLILDYISGGIEHGHVHLQKTNHVHEEHDHEHEHPVISKFPIMMMTGLCIHAFIEGIPLLLMETSDALFVGIIFHNIPISITLTTVFLLAGKTIIQSLSALFVFSLMTPAGAIFAKVFISGKHQLNPDLGMMALGVVIGIFLHISTTILFESDKNHRFNLVKFITIVVGVVFAFLLN